MRKHSQGQFHISGLAALLALTVFALCLLSVLLAGAGVYGNLTEDTSRNHALRTAQQYLATRLRQAEAVWTEDFGGAEALVFPETVEGTTYVTRIYCADGWLRELYTEKNGNYFPEAGEKLLEMDAMWVIIEDNLVTVAFSLPDGTSGQVLSSIEEGAYGE